MARGIYEIKLKQHYFPALSRTDALEMLNNTTTGNLLDNEVSIECIVKEEHTMQLFLLAKTMHDMDKFEHRHIKAVVEALALEMGYYRNYTEVADCITTWVERFDDMTLVDLEEWIIG